MAFVVLLATLAQVFQGVRAQEQQMKKYLLKAHNYSTGSNHEESMTNEGGEDDFTPIPILAPDETQIPSTHESCV